MASEEIPSTAGNNPLPEPTQADSPQAQPAQPEPSQPEKSELRHPQHAEIERRGVTVRRAPRYVPFLILGGLVGVAAAAVVAFAVPGSESYDPGSVFGFFLILFAAGGALLGAATALVLDRLSVRRTEHGVVEAVPETETDTGPARGADTGTDTAEGTDGHPSPQS